MRAGDAQAHERLAGRDEIRVAHSVARARPGRNDIVGPRRGSVPVHGAHCDHERVVRRVVQPPRCRPAVPGGDDDGDALPPCDLDRERQRVEAIVLCAVGAERQVQDADVQTAVLPVLHDPVDRGEHLRDVGRSVRVGDLDAQDASVRRHAGEVLGVMSDGTARVAPGDDSREVGAVPVGVEVAQVRPLRLEGEVRAGDDPARLCQPVDRHDSRVDERNVHAFPGEARSEHVVRVRDVAGNEERAWILGLVPAVEEAVQAKAPVGGHRVHAS